MLCALFIMSHRKIFFYFIFQAEKEKGKRIPSIMQKDNVEKVSKSYESYEEYRKMLTSHLLFDITQKIKKAIATIDIDSR